MRDNITRKKGTLHLVSTPIGNLKDITYRAIETLKSVGLIAAEDTRHTMKLLTHYSIKKRMMSYNDHDHYKREKANEAVIQELLAGVDVALVSDAGTPGISDPGYFLVNSARKNGIKVTACPGPCAAIMALSLSGLPMDKFSFFGYLPPKEGKRRSFLKTLANENRSMVFYEAPGRIIELLVDIHEELGDREIVIARELTKLFEEIVRGRASELLQKKEIINEKGEFTVVVSPPSDEQKKQVSLDELRNAESEIYNLLSKKKPIKVVSELISSKYGISKKEIYNICLRLKK